MEMVRENRDPESKRIWRDGIMGVVTGDALGCPGQFDSREEIAMHPVTTMTGHGTYDMPVGTWTDDSSLTLALLDSIRQNRAINLPDIMYRFALWMTKGEYTPFGEAFDIGRGTMNSIIRYMQDTNVDTCGGTSDHDNGNGSLMRIMPACLYCNEMREAGKLTAEEAISLIHKIGGLTHNHMRAKIACGLYYFMVRSILHEEGRIGKSLQAGMDAGFAFYKKDLKNLTELSYFGRLHNLYGFADATADEIRSSGYVVDSLEAAVWSLLKTTSFKDALLVAVNLGGDTDTIGAVCGGLAGLYYGYEDIPEDWLSVIQRREWIEKMCIDEGKA